jgi:hypothetical protein
MSTPHYQFNDGGRKAAGFKGKTGDCVCRAIAIAAERPYAEVHAYLSTQAGAQRATSRTPKQLATADKGIYTSRKWFKDYMATLGFKWVPTMAIGQGCKVHLRKEELPAGRIICAVSRHYVAVIDGVINDIYDPRRGGTRCVYGYYQKIK